MQSKVDAQQSQLFCQAWIFFTLVDVSGWSSLFLLICLFFMSIFGKGEYGMPSATRKAAFLKLARLLTVSSVFTLARQRDCSQLCCCKAKLGTSLRPSSSLLELVAGAF
jgi:hypothetical protein